MSSFQYNDDEEVEDSWDSAITGRNGFVLLIDASSQMFVKSSQTTPSYFQTCVECSKEIFLNIARKQQMELVSIVLYGTRRTEGRHTPNNVVLLQPLSVITVSRIKQLFQLIKSECEEISDKYGHCKDYVLPHALHYCQTVLLESHSKMNIKNIIIFTCDDNPHKNNPQRRHQTRKQIEELRENNIDFDVVGLGKFDSTLFYKELVLISRGELMKDWTNQDPVLNMSQLIHQVDKICEKHSQRRSYLRLNSDLVLQISLYKLYSEPKKFRTEKLMESDFNSVEGTHIVMNDEDDFLSENVEDVKLTTVEPSIEPREPAQLVLGQNSFSMTRNEFKTDVINLQLGFTLIGFVNTEHVPLYLVKSEPYLMIPASNATNERLVFSQLLKSCLEKSKSMLGWFKLTQSSYPQHAVLHPTPGGEYASGREHSGGFIINRLLFADALHELVEPEGAEAEPSESQQEAADGIVKKLTINYSVDRFSDADVRHYTNMVEALALEYDDVEPVDDDTDADLDGIAERLGDLNDAFNDCEHLGPETTGLKGKTVKNKQADANSIEMIQNGLANKLNVTQLKDLLKAEGVKNLGSMNKSMLVSVANERFGGPQGS